MCIFTAAIHNGGDEIRNASRCRENKGGGTYVRTYVRTYMYVRTYVRTYVKIISD